MGRARKSHSVKLNAGATILTTIKSNSFHQIGFLIWLGLFMAVLAWLFEGYRFPNGNHGQEIPPIQAILDPSLFLTDFAVQSFLQPGPRYFYNHLIALTAGGLGIGVDVALLIWKILSQALFFVSIAFVARAALEEVSGDRFLDERSYAPFAVALAICCTLPVASWGSDIFFATMIPSTLAMAIATWAIYFAIRDWWALAFFVAGLALIFQLLVGLFAGLVLFPALVLAAKRHRSASMFASPVALWMGPAVAIYASMVFVAQQLPDSFDFFSVFGEFRVPHHWLPSTGSFKLWMIDGLLLIAGLLSLLVLKNGSARTRRVVAILGLIATSAVLGVLMNVVGGEMLRITLIGKLQFQRIMPFGHIAIYLLVMLAISRVWQDVSLLRPRKEDILAFTAALLALPSATALSLNAALGSVMQFVVLICFLVAALVFALSGTRLRIAVTILAISTLVFVNLPLAKRLPDPLGRLLDSRYRPTEDSVWAGVAMADWLRENSAKDAILLIPPDWNSFSEFLAMYSERSLYFSFKNVPYSDYAVWVWSQRLEAIIGRPLDGIRRSDLRELWQHNSTEDIWRIGRDARACYLLDRTADRSSIDLDPLIRVEVDGEYWGLWPLQREGC